MVKTATVLPDLQISSLVSLGQVFDDDYSVILDDNKLYALKNKDIEVNFDKKDILLECTLNQIDGLWDIPLHKQSLQSNNYVCPPIHESIYHTSTSTNMCKAF